MKFSIWPNPARPTAEILDLARTADSTGWFGMWFADHYMPNTGSEELAEGDVHECWAMLPAIAAVTSRIRLGPLVAPTSVHHPALLANRAVTIDHVSNGRFVLGIGAGWQINEHHAYGIDLEPPKTRVDRFDEAIQIVRSLLDEDHTDFAGAHYTITNAPCDPKPVQEKLPILVGTGSPRMLRITATHGQEWNTWGAPALAAERRADYERQCERVGVHPASLHTSVQSLFFFQDDPVAVDEILAGDMGDRSIAGSIDHIVDQVGRYVELGFDEVIVPDFTLGRTHDERLATYAAFMSEVASQFS